MLGIPLVSPIFRMVMRIVSVIVFLLTIAAAYGGRVNPEYLTLPSVLCLALPYFGIATIVLTLFWLLSKKIVFTSLGVLTIVACMSPLTQAMPLSFGNNGGKNEESFKIISWNVCHFEDVRNPEATGDRAVEYLLDSGADIICLAEMSNFNRSEFRDARKELLDSLERVYPHRAGLNTTDVKIMSKYPVERIGIGNRESDGKYWYDFFKVRFPEGKTVNVGVVHLYSYDLTEEERRVVKSMKTVDGAKRSLREFKGSILSKLRHAFRMRASNAADLREAIDCLDKDVPLIVCGDYNDVPASWAYNLIRGEDMRDAYAETNIGPAITYNLHCFYFHIDQMLYRGPIEALSLKVRKIKTSDHYPLVGTFAFTEQ